MNTLSLTRTLRFALAVLCATASFGHAGAQAFNVPVTGFNADLVADGVRPGNDPGSTTVTTTSGIDDGNFVFLDGTYQYAAGCSTYTTGVMPANNQIASVAAPGLTYTLQPYDAANTLRIPGTPGTAAGAGTLTLVTPTVMTRLYLLVIAGSGPITNGISVSVTFTDATTQTLLTAGTVGDWCFNTVASGDVSTAITSPSFTRLDAGAAGTCGGTPGTCGVGTGSGGPFLRELSLPVTGNKVVASVTISKTSASGVFNVFAVGAQPPCVTPSAQPTALVQGAPATGQVAGSFTAAAGANGYLVVRYAAGAAPTAPVDGASYLTGQALGAGTVVQASSATAFTATGLTPGTAYDFYVYAYNGTVCGGGPLYLAAAPLMATFSTLACGSGLAAGAYSVGPTGTYTTLTQALGAVNNLGVAGPVVLELQTAYTSTGETFPLTLNSNVCVSAANNVTIRPEAGASNLLITSANTTATMDINGGGFITIDGRPGGTGSTPALTIQNTATAGVALLFRNEATKNRVMYCNVQGVNNTATGGVIQFGTTTGANGNDSNAITFCNISGTSSTSTPATLIYSSGSTTTTAQYNNNDTVANCNLFDFFQAGAESNGFKIGNGNGGNANWAILNNSFYQTASRVGTASAQQYVFNLNCPAASGYVITGNAIGGSAPQCGGTPWTTANTGNFRFTGTFISLLPGGAPSTFSGNTFANFSWTNTGTTTNTSAPGLWSAVQLLNGAVAVTNNTIGSASGASITVSAGGSSNVYGIIGASGNATTTYNITGNTIAGITTTTPSSTTAAVNIYGISVSAGAATTTYNVSGNTVGSLQPNSIFASRATTGAQVIRGIENTGGGRVNVTDNVVRSLTNASVATASIAQTIGIVCSSGVDSVAGNVVTGLQNSAAHTNIGSSASVLGISQTSITAGSTVSKNTVFNLHSTATTGVGVVGIHYTGATTGTNTIAGNFVHSLSAATTAATANIIGMHFSGGASNVQNNMVRVGIDSTGAALSGPIVSGIYETGATNSYYHNSVYVGGSGLASAAASYGFFSTVSSGTRAILNNIFYNARSNGAGAGVHYGIRIGAAAGLTSNGNVVYTPGTGGTFGAVGSTPYNTILAWQAATAQDGASISADPQFIAPTASASGVDLHISPSAPTPVEAAGVTGTSSVTEDFDGQSRAGLTPVDIGADAGNFLPQDAQAPIITYTPLTAIYSAGNQTLTATITDATGVPTTGSLMPRIYFKKFAAGTYTSTAGTLASGSGQNGSWSFSIDASLLGGLANGDSVYYYVIAQDLLGNISSNPTGAIATDVNTVTTPPPAPNAYRVLSYLSGIIPVGAGQTYTTLTDNGGLFQAINFNGLSGDVTAVVSSDLVESGTNSLNAYVTQGGATYRVTIVPDGSTERLISGAVSTGGLIRFSGVRNLKVDGSFNGSGRYLRFRNTVQGGFTMTFLNDAKRDTVTSCIVESNNNTNANIVFAGGVSTGNDSNVISGNLIRDLTNTAGLTNTGISSTTASAPATNSDNLITGNEFVNCIFNGINLNSGATGDGWQITNNSFYYTQTLTNNGMGIILVSAGAGHTITGNSIGGSAPDRSGAATTNTGTNTVNALQIATATGTPTVVSNNTVSNMSVNSTLVAVNVTSGTVTVSGNYIGTAASPQAHDTLRAGASGGLITLAGATTASGNMVKNASYYGGGAVRLAGILVTGGTHSVSGNTVDNLKSNSNGATTTNNLVGIAVTGGTGHTVRGNTISNLNHFNTGTTGYFVGGIVVTGNTGSTWAANRISNVYSAGTGTGASAPQVAGFYITSTAVENMMNNQISVGSNTTAETRLIGILEGTNSSTNTHNYFNNAVYLSGGAGGSNNTYAFWRTGSGSTVTPVSLRNNILYNGRSGGSGFHYALGFFTATLVYSPGVSNYNLLVATDTTRVVELGSTGTGIGAYNATFTTQPNQNWMAGTATVPEAQLFANAAAGDLSVNPANIESWYAHGKGLPLAAVATDFNGAPRSTTVASGATDIGSTEFTPAVAPPSAVESAPPAAGTTNFYSFGGRTIARFAWDASGTPPASLDVKYFSGTTPQNTGSSPVSNAYYDITANGGSGYGYTVELAYDSSMLGTVPSLADVRLAKYDGAGPWTQYPGSSMNPVTGFLSSNTTLNSFSQFTGGSNATPLPIRAITLTATPDGDAVRLDWTVDESAAGGRFSLLRSADGFSFEELASVAAGATSTRYAHADEHPLSGTAYYRVRLTEASGEVRMSPTVRLHRSNSGDANFAMRISPNPVTSIMRVRLTGEVPADARLTVTDLMGRVVLSQAAGRGEAVVDMSGMPAGVYILQLKGTGRSEAVRILKQ